MFDKNSSSHYGQRFSNMVYLKNPGVLVSGRKGFLWIVILKLQARLGCDMIRWNFVRFLRC